MSFFSSLAHFFGNVWHAVTGSGPNVLHQTLTGINIVEPLLVLGVQDADPAAAPEVKAAVDEIRKDMTALSDLIAESTNPKDSTVLAKVQTALTAINSQIANLLSVGHIKNTTLQNEIQAGLSELEAVVASIHV